MKPLLWLFAPLLERTTCSAPGRQNGCVVSALGTTATKPVAERHVRSIAEQVDEGAASHTRPPFSWSDLHGRSDLQRLQSKGGK